MILALETPRVFKITVAALLAAVLTGACSSDNDEIIYQENTAVQTSQAPDDDDKGFRLSNWIPFIGGSEKKDNELGVNGLLWRATLDTLSFLPLEEVDSQGGVVITEWYANPDVPTERFKIIAYILDRTLRADGLKINVFRQVSEGNGIWRDAPVRADTTTKIEDAVLTRAREFRIDTP